MRFIFLILSLSFFQSFARTLMVGKKQEFRTIHQALVSARDGDVIFVQRGIYRERTLLVDKSVRIEGINSPILDGENRFEIILIQSNNVEIKGFKIINSGRERLKNIAAIHLYNVKNCIVDKNDFQDDGFAVYLENCSRCVVENNHFTSIKKIKNVELGNGIHAVKSTELVIRRNQITQNRDGIYLEKVKNSYIYENNSSQNLRYGLHFMFCDNNVFLQNIFRDNNSGVSVMYSKNVLMVRNQFVENKRSLSNGLLLKKISESQIKYNLFSKNITGVLMDEVTHVSIEHNDFKKNNLAIKINSNTKDSGVFFNNFIHNIFDVSTDVVKRNLLFYRNYWSQYRGYDFNKDGKGDRPFYPVSLYSVWAQKTPMVMLFYQSPFMYLLEGLEKMAPSLIPKYVFDSEPVLKKYNLNLKKKSSD